MAAPSELALFTIIVKLTTSPDTRYIGIVQGRPFRFSNCLYNGARLKANFGVKICYFWTLVTLSSTRCIDEDFNTSISHLNISTFVTLTTFILSLILYRIIKAR